MNVPGSIQKLYRQHWTIILTQMSIGILEGFKAEKWSSCV